MNFLCILSYSSTVYNFRTSRSDPHLVLSLGATHKSSGKGNFIFIMVVAIGIGLNIRYLIISNYTHKIVHLFNKTYLQ